MPSPSASAGVAVESVHVYRTLPGLFYHDVSRVEEYRHCLTRYTPADYAKMRCFTAFAGMAGYALRGDEIVSVFNRSKIRGLGRAVLRHAIAMGGRRLDCFDGKLVDIYKSVGFVEESRLAWDDAYAPEGWDYETHGRPDVVVMRYDPEYHFALCLE